MQEIVEQDASNSIRAVCMGGTTPSWFRWNVDNQIELYRPLQAL